MYKNIIITGATGFVGSNLVNTFSDNDRVYSLGRKSSGECENIYWNLKDNLKNIKLPGSIDTVIHCAAIVGEDNCSKKEYIEINLISTLELLEFCKNAGITQFIYISTGGIYGFGKFPFREEDQPKPQGIYNLSKYFSEELCKQYNDKFMITILRIFFPYGKGQKKRLISNLIEQINRGEKITLNNNGGPLINPIYVDDICTIIKKVVDNRLRGTFNLCGNDIISIKELCEIISQKLKTQIPEFCFNGKEAENLIGKNEKIQLVLNSCIKTNISEGLTKMID